MHLFICLYISTIYLFIYCYSYLHLHSNVSYGDSISKLLLSQLRWLDEIVEPEQLAQKLLEVFSVCPSHLQREIIGALPEIIDDSQHEVGDILMC